MRFAHTNSYPAAPAAVLAMLGSPAFREEVCRSQRALEHSVDTSEDGGMPTVRISQTQSMEKAPAIARKFTGDSVEIVQDERWTATADGRFAADFSMAIPGKPGQLRGSIALVETATGTDEVFTGEVKVSIPLVAGKLEKLVADLLSSALRREGRTGKAWLERA